MKVKLQHVAHARSGDKGDTSNIAVFAYAPELYPLLVEQLTAERFKAFYGGAIRGEILRYPVEALHAINFVCHGALGGGDMGLVGLLVLAGPLTALPLLLFAAGARRLPLATVGLLQYISPSLQLVLGIWVFHEPFDGDRFVGFACIWAGLVIYSFDALLRSRASAASVTPTPG